MSIGRSDNVISKEDSALRLYERGGLETDLIAERFGVTRGAVNLWLKNARRRREESGLSPDFSAVEATAVPR